MSTRQPLYGTEHWRTRSKLQRQSQPLCEECLKAGVVMPAEEADHVERHGNDRNRFYLGRLQSLCRDCHARKTLAENRRDPTVLHRDYSIEVGVDGWYVDPRHPSNVADRERQALLKRLDAEARHRQAGDAPKPQAVAGSPVTTPGKSGTFGG